MCVRLPLNAVDRLQRVKCAALSYLFNKINMYLGHQEKERHHRNGSVRLGDGCHVAGDRDSDG